MSEKNYMNNSQASEIMKFISDEMKFPILGAGGGYAPIGVINALMGTSAPQGWLVCDGHVYNITDYPELASYFASHFGASNYFGGNGTTTFAVPDLRGEFLRGSGTNSHTNQGSGGSVGEHQDATEMPNIRAGGNDLLFPNTMTEYVPATNMDATNPKNYSTSANKYVSFANGSILISNFKSYTSRPTNTSVLFIIKATVSDAEINAFNVYTPREHQVAWWEEEIDGVWKRKPVYERTITGTTADTFALTDLDAICSIDGTYTFGSQGGGTEGATRRFAGTDSTSELYGVLSTVSDSGVLSFVVRGLTGTISIQATFRYTKSSDEWQTS